MYQEAKNSEDNGIEVASDVENKLILSLAKFRAYIYDIIIVDNDEELLRRALNCQICQKSTANLTAQFIIWELFKIQQNMKSNDWWTTERGGLSVVKSQTISKTRMVGKFKLGCWENLKISGTNEWTLENLLEFMENMGLTVTLITHNSKMIYMKCMPTHANKKKKL